MSSDRKEQKTGWFPGKMIKTTLFSPSTNEQEISSENEDQNHDSVLEDEKTFFRMLKIARKKFIDNGVVGNIELYCQFLSMTKTISCDIDAECTPDQAHEEERPEDEEKLSILERAVERGMDRCLKTLESRAAAYRTISYAHQVTLSSGCYVTLPFYQLTSISITFSATVLSLFTSIANRAHRKLLES